MFPSRLGGSLLTPCAGCTAWSVTSGLAIVTDASLSKIAWHNYLSHGVQEVNTLSCRCIECVIRGQMCLPPSVLYLFLRSQSTSFQEVLQESLLAISPKMGHAVLLHSVTSNCDPKGSPAPTGHITSWSLLLEINSLAVSFQLKYWGRSTRAWWDNCSVAVEIWSAGF
jgi:hypothetical protein